MKKTKKVKLTKLEHEFNKLEHEFNKLECDIISNQLNEKNNKKQKSRKRKTLSLKDLLTKNDTEIDKNEKANLLKYLFINHVITGSEIKDLVKKEKIDQKLYNEINTDPEVVELQDRIILDLTQKLLVLDCQQYFIELLAKKFIDQKTRPTKLETTEQTEQLQESDQNSENQLKIEHSLCIWPLPPPISEDEITKFKNMDLKEINKHLRQELKEYIADNYNPKDLEELTRFVFDHYNRKVVKGDSGFKENKIDYINVNINTESNIKIVIKNNHVLSKSTTEKIAKLEEIINSELTLIPTLEKRKLSQKQFNDFLTSYDTIKEKNNLKDSDIIVVNIEILGELHKIIVDCNYNHIDKRRNSLTQEEERNIITFYVRVEIV